jgi:hypothetical protein
MRLNVTNQSEALIRHLRQKKTADWIVKCVAEAEKEAAGVTDEERIKTYMEARNDPMKQRAMAAARLQVIGRFVLAHTWAGSFVDVVNLADNEQPVVRTRTTPTGHQWVHWVAQNGGARKHRIPADETDTVFRMKKLTTREIEYPVAPDINTGADFLGRLADAQARAAYEMGLLLDADCKALLDAAALSSGLRATLDLHPSIVAASIPDINSMALSGVGTSGTMDIEKLKRILEYAVLFSQDAEEDGQPLTIRAIYLSTLQLRDWWDFTSLVSNTDGSVNDGKDTIPAGAVDEVFRTGKITQAFGQSFTLIPRNTIAKGTMYVAMNKPAGTMWVKPGMDVAEDIPQSRVQFDEGLRSWRMSKVVQLTLHSPYTYRFLKVTL